MLNGIRIMAISKLKISTTELLDGKQASIWLEYDTITLDITSVGYDNGLAKLIQYVIEKDIQKQEASLSPGAGKVIVGPVEFGKAVSVPDPGDPQQTIVDLPADFFYQFSF